MIIPIIILILILISVKYCYELHTINHNSTLIQIQDPNEINIKENLKNKSPLIVYNLISKYDSLSEITIESLIQNNPGYIINDNGRNISLSTFSEESVKQMVVFNNPHMIKDFKFNKEYDEILKLFGDNLICNLKHELSIFKGNHALSLLQNKHNIQLFTQINGTTTFYIFNPKHESDIKNKNNHEIKKWATKIDLKPGLLLYIPPNWNYIYEINNDSILCSSYCDNYFTFLYNIFR
jgi:hypothetical protein